MDCSNVDVFKTAQWAYLDDYTVASIPEVVIIINMNIMVRFLVFIIRFLYEIRDNQIRSRPGSRRSSISSN